MDTSEYRGNVYQCIPLFDTKIERTHYYKLASDAGGMLFFFCFFFLFGGGGGG